MLYDSTNTIDFVYIEKSEKSVVIVIADELDWLEEKKHLWLLQEKINTYLEFIEGGQLYKECPDSEGKQIVIEIYFAFPVSELGLKFLEYAQSVIEEANYSFRYKNRPFKDIENFKPNPSHPYKCQGGLKEGNQ